MPCSYSQHWYFFLTDASVKKNFAAEAVSNIPRSHYCREEEGGTRLAKEGGSSKQRREGWKEGKKKGS